jgi:hypothetical protein
MENEYNVEIREKLTVS